MVKNQWKDYFAFSQSERRGILMLVVILSMLTFFRWYLPQYVIHEPLDNSQFLAEYQALLLDDVPTEKKSYPDWQSRRQAPIAKELNDKEATDRQVEKPQSFVLQSFDPNTASVEELVSLGISEKVSRTILNYRNKGGKFFAAADLQKIYGLPAETFAGLKDYIEIEKTEKTEKKVYGEEYSKPKYGDSTYQSAYKPYYKTSKPKAPLSIPINSATAEEYQKLRGIGPAYSERIVKFREQMGGFHSIEQIAAVYGLSDSLFQSIKGQLVFDKVDIKQIVINEISEDSLKLHPLINWRTAKAIINYREVHGSFDSLQSLGACHAVNDSLLTRLTPYLAF